MHGTTYGGNPLAMAAGNAVLDIMLADGFLDDVRHKALRLKQGLHALADRFPDVFAEVRGEGLMTGLKCAVPNADVVAALFAGHMLVVPAGDNVVRILPPLTVSDDEIGEGLSRLEAAARGLSANRAA